MSDVGYSTWFGYDHNHKQTCLADLSLLGQLEGDGIERGLPDRIFVNAKAEEAGAGGPDELMFRDHS